MRDLRQEAGTWRATDTTPNIAETVGLRPPAGDFNATSTNRVLMIASAKSSGLNFNLTRLVLQLHRQGQEVVVVASEKEQEKGLGLLLRNAGIHFYECRHIDGTTIISILEGAIELSRVIRKEDINVVHCNGVAHLAKAYLAAKVLNSEFPTLLVTSVHSTLHATSAANLGLLYVSLVTGVLSDVVLPVSETLRLELIHRFLPPEKALTVHNGVDTQLMDDAAGVKGDDSVQLASLRDVPGPLIGCFASLHRWKGQAFLVEAAQRVVQEFPSASFALTGEGPCRNDLERLVDKLGLEHNVHLLGRVSFDALFRITQRLDVYVFPSLAELFPFAVLEPMAASKPVIATRVGGIPEVVRHGENGYLVPPRDATAIADAILHLLRNPSRAQEMGRKGRELIDKDFSASVAARKLRSIYRLRNRNTTEGNGDSC